MLIWSLDLMKKCLFKYFKKSVESWNWYLEIMFSHKFSWKKKIENGKNLLIFVGMIYDLPSRRILNRLYFLVISSILLEIERQMVNFTKMSMYRKFRFQHNKITPKCFPNKIPFFFRKNSDSGKIAVSKLNCKKYE